MKNLVFIFIFIISSITIVNAQLFECGEVLIDERDGKEYTTVQIGEQCWMSQNLNVGTKINQNGNNNQTDNSVIEKYCYNNNELECDEYGGLYQWNEMMQYETDESSQGICPDGWHLPSDVEWMQMEMSLGMSEEDVLETGFERGTNEGIQLQLGGESGFDALFGGIWYQDAGFVYNEDYPSVSSYGTDFYFTYFWSTTPGDYTDSYFYRNVCSRVDEIPTITRWYVDWNFGYSVRCVADEFRSSYNFQFDGKDYEIVKVLKTWEDAAADAVDHGGYLVEINSVEEQNAVYDAIINGAEIPTDYLTINNGGGIAYVWMGASDKTTEGTWLWDGNDDSEGSNFWIGQGVNGTGDGQAVDEAYYNWGGTSDGTPNEPDNYASNQNAGAIALEGWPLGNPFLGSASEWNDIINTSELYYVIEYDVSSINLEDNFVFEIYPNPATNYVIINSQNIKDINSISMTSITGSKTYQVDNNNVNSFEIDMSYLPAGIYLISLYDINNKLIGSEKIVKK